MITLEVEVARTGNGYLAHFATEDQAITFVLERATTHCFWVDFTATRAERLWEALDALAHDDAEARAEIAAELEIERALERAGEAEAELQQRIEDAAGVLGFREAWHVASPQTCPCPSHS